MLILLLEESISITGTAAITSLSDVISAAGTETITGTAAVTTTADVAAAAGTETITGTAAALTLDDIAYGVEDGVALARRLGSLGAIRQPQRNEPATHISVAQT